MLRPQDTTTRERKSLDKKGVFTRDRAPKSAAFALRRRWRGDDRDGT